MTATTTRPAAPLPHPGDRHRSDVQGLRGIAVVLVVAFHAGLAVPGGYVGVDVFFVISGFVIMLALQRESHQTGTISLRRFYTRRARRLLPALAVLLTAVLLVSTQVLDVVGGQQETAETARAASLLTANLELAEQSASYFSDDAERNPLLHTWSLSVEEQFYLVLPGLVLVALAVDALRRRLSPRDDAPTAVVVATWTITVASFAAMLLQADGARENFFATPVRAWEFGAGVLLALHLDRLAPRRAGTASAAALTGLALIGVAAIAFSDTTPFPSAATLLPVGGAAMVLAAGTRVRTPATALLDSTVLGWIGDRSYSWYLWHWPAIVFARLLWPDTALAPVVAATASIVPAALVYELVEQPIRRQRQVVGLAAATLAVVAIVVPVATSAIVEQRAEEAELLAGAELASKSRAFELGCEAMPWPAAPCTLGDVDAPRRVALLGDSHALQWAVPLGRAGEEAGFATHVFSKPGCPALLRHTDHSDNCGGWQRHVVDTVLTLDPDVVVIANRTPAYLPGPGEQVATVHARDGTAASDRIDALRIWEHGLLELLAELDRPTIVMLTGPEHGRQLHDAVRGLRAADQVPELPVDAHAARSGDAHALERRVAAQAEQWTTVDPADALCHDTCAVRRDGRWLYFDDDHLSPAGAQLVAPRLIAEVRALLAATA